MPCLYFYLKLTERVGWMQNVTFVQWCHILKLSEQAPGWSRIQNYQITLIRP
jgi:hypothetical protein